MKKKLAFFALTFFALSCRLALAQVFTAADVEPSFKYGGEAFDKSKWEKTESVLKDDPQIKITRRAYRSPDSLLELSITIKEFREFDVVEWLCEFENIGSSDTAVVSDLKNLDWAWQIPPEHSRNFFVRAHNGGNIKLDEFAPINREVGLRSKGRFEIVNDTGRSSCMRLPFFAVDIDELNGFFIGIGWSGSWKASVNVDGLGREVYTNHANPKCVLRIDAGHMRTNFKLFPKEKIRTMSMFVANRRGIDAYEAQNRHRRFMLKFHSPLDADGKLIRAPFSYAFHGCCPEKKIFAAIELAKKNGAPLDLCWLDAGWYGPDVERPENLTLFGWWQLAGYWRVNRKLFPDGIKKVFDFAHENGMKSMLWFETERAGKDAPIIKEKPEYFMEVKTPNRPINLLQMGEAEPNKYIFDTVSKLMDEEHIDCLRNDFNCDPLSTWKRLETPDRVGIPEIKYITGLYKFWDALREHKKGMFIDNCASGGRRLDFELAGRSMPLWRSDTPCEYSSEFDEANQLAVFYLSQWLPLHACGVKCRFHDEYSYLSGLAAGIVFDFDDDHFKEGFMGKHAEILRKCRRVADLFYFDMYPLVESPENMREWFSYQLSDPAGARGCAVALRRKYSPIAERVLELRGIDEAARYEVEDWNGKRSEVSGAELKNFRVKLEKPRSFAVFFYKKI